MTGPAISEAAWQEQFIELAQLGGWEHMHVRRTRGRNDQWTTSTSCSGWPDLTLWHERHRELIVVELKSDTGVTSPEQRRVLLSLERAGVPAYVLRPKDLPAARIILGVGAPREVIGQVLAGPDAVHPAARRATALFEGDADAVRR